MANKPENHLNCRCWKCFIQDNFTAVALFFMVVFGLVLTLIMMHEPKMNEKSLNFIEGFVGGAFSTWTLSLRTSEKPTPHVDPPPPPAPEPEVPPAPSVPPAAGPEVPAEPEKDQNPNV